MMAAREEVKGNGTRETMTGPDKTTQMHVCCYLAELAEEGNDCSIGRPYFDGGKELRAPLLSHDAPLPPASARATAWAAAGSGEHASVAAFARLSLQLLRFGAPSDLLHDVHQAAMDELSHAEICWAIAQRFGAPRVSAGPFPFPDVLSFRIVAWALRVGGAAVKSAVCAAFADPWPKLDVEELALRLTWFHVSNRSASIGSSLAALVAG